MRVIKEVKSENERLKAGMRGMSSVASTPRSISSSTTQRSVRDGRQIFDRARPRPLDRAALIATPTNSERSTQSAPVMTNSTYGMEDPLHHRYGNHPDYQALARGAPPSSTERETMAGQPGFQRKLAGPMKGDELQERLQRRTTLSMLYSGAAPQSTVTEKDRSEVPTRAAQPALQRRGQRPSSGAANKPTRVGSAQQRITDARSRTNGDVNSLPPHNGGRDTNHQNGEPPMIRRNVVRDLAAFYDAHIQHANDGLGGGGVPWEGVDIPGPSIRVGGPQSHQRSSGDHYNPYVSASSHLVPPPPVLPADFQFAGNRGQPTVAESSPLHYRSQVELGSLAQGGGMMPPLGSTTTARSDREQVAQKISHVLLGGQDALDLHMKRRPYDVGPPPVPPQPYRGVTKPNDQPLIGSYSSLSSTRGGAVGSTTSSSSGMAALDTFVLLHDEDKLHQHANAVLRASQERVKHSPYTKPRDGRPLSSSSATYQSVPPPPALPADFMKAGVDRFNDGAPAQPTRSNPAVPISCNQERLDWSSPTRGDHRQGVASSLSSTNGGHGRPSSVATDLSVDGEDVGALLNWAASLNTHGGGGGW